MQQLDIFQLECEYLAIVLGSLRAQLTQLQAMQARLMLKADDPGKFIRLLAPPALAGRVADHCPDGPVAASLAADALAISKLLDQCLKAIRSLVLR